MRIAASDIALESASSKQRYTEVHEELTKGFVRAGDAFNKDNLVEGIHVEQTRVEKVNELDKSEHTYSDLRRPDNREEIGKYSLDQLLNQASSTGSKSVIELAPEDRFKIELMKKIFESLTGTKFTVGMLADSLSGEGTTQENSNSPQGEISDVSSLNISSSALEFGASYSYHRIDRTDEQMSFQASGEVHTKDGKTINIDLNLNLSRSLQESTSFQIRAGAALKDPLVINFSGNAAELTEQTYNFDIDLDGEEELLHKLSENSGYIALDKNGNGEVDDGSELFGATSGNGFRELAQYDEDKDGFIDEDDSIWEQLRIWVQHADGSSSMFSLADKNIGALYLGYTDTDWDLEAGQNSSELGGKVRATGIFLTEDGNSGTLQQIDLVV